jgi:hypothetical protein
MRRFASFILLTSVCLGSGWLVSTPKSAWAYPEPAIVSPSWSLEVEVTKPAAISIEDVDGSIRWFWYVTYKVVNPTDEDLLFIPEITVANDLGEIITAGENVPPTVFPAIKERLGNPLLLSPIQVVGKLLRGDDFAREGVAIWPAPDGDVDAFSVFIAGLNGETQTIANPLTGESVLVRRTLMLEYKSPGNFQRPQDQPIVEDGRREVMR